jgi:hypothetical protein
MTKVKAEAASTKTDPPSGDLTTDVLLNAMAEIKSNPHLTYTPSVYLGQRIEAIEDYLETLSRTMGHIGVPEFVRPFPEDST